MMATPVDPSPSRLMGDHHASDGTQGGMMMHPFEKSSKPMAMDYDYGKTSDYENDKHSADLRDDWNTYNVYVSDTSVGVRMAFIRKVYATLSIQLAVTTIFIFAGAFSPAYKTFLLNNHWLVMVTMFGSFGLMLALHMMKDKYPTNLALLGAWTLCMALMVSASTVMVPAAIVCQAFFLTFAVVSGLTVYTFKSKKDFSAMEGGLVSALWILILVGFMRIFFPFGPAMHLMYAAGGAILFAGFLVFDTFNIIKKHSVDDWIPAVLSLYLDILNLFLHILQLLSSRRD